MFCGQLFPHRLWRLLGCMYRMWVVGSTYGASLHTPLLLFSSLQRLCYLQPLVSERSLHLRDLNRIYWTVVYINYCKTKRCSENGLTLNTLSYLKGPSSCWICILTNAFEKDWPPDRDFPWEDTNNNINIIRYIHIGPDRMNCRNTPGI